jgi:hypothetical protein
MKSTVRIPGSRFPLGQVAISRTAQGRISLEDAEAGVRRHARGDWGSVPVEKRLANEAAVREGHAVLSRYRASSGHFFWIITDYDRASTTVF